MLVLAMITAQKPLLRAFIADVLVYKWQRLDKQLTDADGRAFLAQQAEQHPEIAAWSPATVQKTRGNLTRFSVDAGLLKERGQGEFDILPQYLPLHVKVMLQDLDPLLLPLLEVLQ